MTLSISAAALYEYTVYLSRINSKTHTDKDNTNAPINELLEV